MRQAGLFGLPAQLKRLSDEGGPLETLSRVVDFTAFRPALETALAYADGAKGGRPPYDPVAMLKVLILAAQHTVSDARWTVKFAKARPLPGGKPDIDIAIPSFGYKSSIAICRTFGCIRKGKVTDAATFDGRMLKDVVTTDNTASDVWADTAYRSQANEAWLERHGRISRIHRNKPRGRPLPECTAKANAAKSSVRARVEHVFARQKDQRTSPSAPSASPAPRPR
jgi:hypothetical protein